MRIQRGVVVLSLHLSYFTSSSAGVYYDMDDGETGNFSYNYTPPSSEGSNVGEVSVVSEWIQNDADYPIH